MTDDGVGRGAGEPNEPGRSNPGRNPLRRLFAALAHSRRRRVLYYFSNRDGGTVATGELAKWIAASETGYRPETLVESEYADVRRALHREHLPQLHERGLVDYDPRSGAVRARRLPRAVLVALSIGRFVERIRPK